MLKRITVAGVLTYVVLEALFPGWNRYAMMSIFGACMLVVIVVCKRLFVAR